MTENIKKTILNALEVYKSKGVFYEQEETINDIDEAIDFISLIEIDTSLLSQTKTTKLHRIHITETDTEHHQLTIDELLG